MLEDPEPAVVAQEDHCGQGLGGLVAATMQVEGVEHQLPLGPDEVAADLGFVGGLAGNHQDLPVDWAAPGIALVASPFSFFSVFSEEGCL